MRDGDVAIVTFVVALIVVTLIVVAFGHRLIKAEERACENRGGVYVQAYEGFKCVEARR